MLSTMPTELPCQDFSWHPKYGAWARLEGVTPHVLRHTFAYIYLENNNNDLVALADILGHSDLNSTRIYTKRRLRDLQEGAERVKFY